MALGYVRLWHAMVCIRHIFYMFIVDLHVVSLSLSLSIISLHHEESQSTAGWCGPTDGFPPDSCLFLRRSPWSMVTPFVIKLIQSGSKVLAAGAHGIMRINRL